MNTTTSEATGTILDDDRASTIPLQPEPIDTTFAYTHNGAGYSTSIARGWDSMADVERCHLCPPVNCLARRDGLPRCIIAVPTFVEKADMELFSLSRWLVAKGITLDAPPADKPKKGRPR
jgi:hypothetical protein